MRCVMLCNVRKWPTDGARTRAARTTFFERECYERDDLPPLLYLAWSVIPRVQLEPSYRRGGGYLDTLNGLRQVHACHCVRLGIFASHACA